MTLERIHSFVFAAWLCAAPAPAQRAARAAEFRRATGPATASEARAAHAVRPSSATDRSPAAAGRAARRRDRLLIGAIVGGLVGGAVGGYLGVRASAVGCDAMMGTECRRPRHTWVYPTVGVGLGAGLGAWMGMLHDRAVEPSS